MELTPHVHVLDIGEGDWGAYPDRRAARVGTLKAITDFNEFATEPYAIDDFTIVDSEEWCADGPEICYYDRNAFILRCLRQEPEWTYDYPPPPLTTYRIDGKRVPRWKMATSMTIELAHELWSTEGYPVALPHWRYDNILANSELCPCKSRSHRKKGCLIGPDGRRCVTCGALYTDYGNSMNQCLACDTWRTEREIYLAEYVAEHGNKTSSATQLALIPV